MKRTLLAFFLMMMMLIQVSCDSDDDKDDSNVASSRSYKGHEIDEDTNNLCSAYPDLIGTRLDDCQTCHTGELEEQTVEGDTTTVWVLASNACDYCHEQMEAEPFLGYFVTLNPYGQAYFQAGRSVSALNSIADDDSDDDGFTNEEEIAAGYYPGYDQSNADTPWAPTRTLNMADLQALPEHSQFLLSNSRKQEYDDYASYSGVKVVDILNELNINTDGAEGVTIIAPDGYYKTFDIENVINPYSPSIWYAGLDDATLGEECGFVNYPEASILPDGLVDTQEIPGGDLWLTIAWEHDGMALDPCYLDEVEYRIEGEGPYRVIVPQEEPGAPDRGLEHSQPQCEDDWDYNDAADHNAGSMVRGVTVIRIDPMPAGFEEFDYVNGGWAYIDNEEIVVYGFGITAD